MEIFRVFDDDTRWVADTCVNQVANYPQLLSKPGLIYLEKRGYYSGKRNNGICCLLPFLLQDAFNLNKEVCRDVSVGASFILLYFYSQDEIMDVRPGEYKGHLLPLSNLFYQDFMAVFQSLLPSSETFWQLEKKYINEWAQSVLWEREEHWGQAKGYSDDDIILLARKCAPLKIPCAAMSLLGGREELIESLEKMVDYSQVVFQLRDDLKDWRRDLRDRNYTYLLVKILEHSRLDSISDLTEAEVVKQLNERGALREVFALMDKYSSLTRESIKELDAPYLKEYFQVIDNYCKCLVTTGFKMC